MVVDFAKCSLYALSVIVMFDPFGQFTPFYHNFLEFFQRDRF